MNLELKHFATYMPYGLKVQYYDDERGRMTICDIVELRIDEITITDSQNQYEVEFYEVRPMLTPMSELTQEMLINAGFDSHIDYLTHELQSENASKNPQMRNGKRSWRIEAAPYEMVAWLIANLFDVFDLINCRMAITITDTEEDRK